ncbi:hypothetical protein ONE63_001053 [Megalurothrips usitatus]|uniref:Uncharacterized protein n=1 Tax=Megalurothrips usitatus TaxID=439358 RepID=A0AAV7XEP2_9NEOP|nr:hypothetical protein ONE63_001053 [Megalurothrips usitatus]
MGANQGIADLCEFARASRTPCGLLVLCQELDGPMMFYNKGPVKHCMSVRGCDCSRDGFRVSTFSLRLTYQFASSTNCFTVLTHTKHISSNSLATDQQPAVA